MQSLFERLHSTTGDGLANVIIDTPAGSPAKFKYDEKCACYKLSRLLPGGMAFPYNFGAVPHTAAEDGDPLDVLVLAQAPFFVGCLVSVKLIGIICAEQTERGKTIRNDRLLGAPVTTVNPALYEHIDDVGPILLADIEYFFVSYNAAQGRTFEPLGRGGPDEALQALRDAEQCYAKQR